MENIAIPQQIININPISLFSQQVSKGVEILNTCTEITSAVNADNAAVILNKGKTLINLVDKKVDELCRPLKDQKKEIDEAQRKIKAFADEVTAPIREAAQKVETAIIAYNKKQRDDAEKVRKEQQEAEELRLKQEAQKEAERIAAETGVKPEDVQVTIKPSEPTPVQVIEPPKPKGLTTVWKYEIENAHIVPRDYCSPDAGLINAAVKSGIREIKGIKIYSEDIIKRS